MTTDTASTIAPTTAFTSLINGHICLNYINSNEKPRSLYELAIRKSWQVNSAPWRQMLPKTASPLRHDYEALRGFADFDNLSASDKTKIEWRRHRMDVSDILHGEQGALLMASQLVICLPDIDSKLFASSQVLDEARHVEFFSRYLLEVAGGIEPASIPLKNMIDDMVSDQRWDFKFIACQILIESVALARLQELRRATVVPVLKFAIDYMTADEARHVHFGTDILRKRIRQLSTSQIQQHSDYVLDNLLRLGNAMNSSVRLADDMGWSAAALRRHLRKRRLANPGLRQGTFRQLRLNLKSAGLLTDKTQRRMQLIESGL